MNPASVNISADSLVQQCIKGNTTAYRLLYNRYSQAMFNTALRIVNNTADAEDILQDSFIDAFQQLEKFEGRSTFGTSIKQIVIYKSIGYLKKKRVFLEDIDDYTGSLADENTTGDEQIRYTVDSIKEAFRQLPDGYRTVLSLYLFENHKQEEIAKMLNISHATVRTQYMRAKNKLLTVLKKGETS